MKTFRKAVLLASLAAASMNCSWIGDANEMSVRLEDGSEITVYLEEEIVEDQKVLVIDHRSDTPRASETDVENDVKQIWESVRQEADKRGYTEALIKYRLPDPEPENQGQYLGLLFEAEKVENGSWKLKKVN